MEYFGSSYHISDSVYGSVFFTLTGFHGIHVFIGTCFIIVCFFRFLKYHFTPNHHFGFLAASWYWHFVDVVWILLFCIVYLWGNSFDDTLNDSLARFFID
jgi:cytochrome c oxidase subunit 3